MSRWVTSGGSTGGHPPSMEIQATATGVQRGEVLVPTQIGVAPHGLLSCAAAPLVAGSLLRKGCQVRLTPVPRCDDPLADNDALLYLATVPQQEGTTTAVAAAAAPEDKLSAANCRAAVEEWAALAGTRLLLAAGSPWCSGAARAAEACRQAAAEHAGRGRGVLLLESAALPPDTADELVRLGAVPVSSLADAQEGDVVVFPAHGVRPEVRLEAAERGLTVVDATCPLISSAHETMARLAERDQDVVLIGKPDAAATGPITSRAAGHVTVVESPAGTASMQVRDAKRVSYMLQPGMPVEAGSGVAAALRSRYPAVRGPQSRGLCYAASDRAAALHSVAVGSDVLFILGDGTSADARQLCVQARTDGAKVHVIGAASDITPAMLAGVTAVGLAESTSARASLAAEVTAAIAGLGPLSVARRDVTTDVAATAR
jgi:4-hydroxy-3-methylbut-2-en-1-yl diphosphate reductase